MKIIDLLLKSEKIDTSIKDSIFGKSPNDLLKNLKTKNIHGKKK